MANIDDYTYWRGDLSFKQDSFNLIDALIMTQIVYVDFLHSVPSYPSPETITLHDAVKEAIKDTKKAAKDLGLIVPHAIIGLTEKASHTKRFGKIELSNYINYIDKREACQFAAMTFKLSEDLVFVSLRGTDDTLIGWQENLDMVCKFPVPAQEYAKRYVTEIAKLYPNANIIIGGHSKGGNLAVYAGIYVDDSLNSRIKEIISFDGPGFIPENIDVQKYEKVKNKIICLMPEDAVVGLIFSQFAGKTVIVKANKNGVNQHDAFNWLIKITTFEKAKEVSPKALKFNESLDNLLKRLSAEERYSLAKNFYEFVLEVKKDTLTEAQKDWFTVLRKLGTINGKNRRLFMSLIYDFIRFRQL